jgi:septum formation protein
VVKLVGSYTNVVGLPLTEVFTLLKGEGFPVTYFWPNLAEIETE